MDPFKHENGRVNNNTLSLVITQIRLGLATPATTTTRTKPKSRTPSFWRERIKARDPSHREAI